MQASRRGFVLGLLVAASSGVSHGQSAKLATSPAKTAVGLVRLRAGKEWLRDCVPWVPRGLSFFGRLIPKGWNSDPGTMAARESFGPWNVEAVKWMVGDVIRLQVGMPFLDPKSPQYNAAYLDEIGRAVAMARDGGLTVILSLQYQSRTNVKPVEFLPKDSARRSWQALGPVFSGDWGVIYELFNEPVGPPQPDARRWEMWRSGHQVIIDDLRGAGVANVLIVDGLNGAHTFRGAPALKDPLQQLAYGVHPYFRENYTTPSDWDQAFGEFAKSRAVLVTEWGHSAEKCELGGETQVEQLLEYLETRRIGVVAYGADEQGSKLMTRRGDAFEATSFQGRACGQRGAGPGELLKKSFQRSTALNRSMKSVDKASCGLR
ncbi:MAG TPA: cellulase family glycosylhydrolase [Ideonella sp.]|nr:cellulase family glycosylhydrolase [Ideonella sp.]